LCNISFFIPI